MCAYVIFKKVLKLREIQKSSINNNFSTKRLSFSKIVFTFDSIASCSLKTNWNDYLLNHLFKFKFRCQFFWRRFPLKTSGHAWVDWAVMISLRFSMQTLMITIFLFHLFTLISFISSSSSFLRRGSCLASYS